MGREMKKVKNESSAVVRGFVSYWKRLDMCDEGDMFCYTLPNVF